MHVQSGERKRERTHSKLTHAVWMTRERERERESRGCMREAKFLSLSLTLIAREKRTEQNSDDSCFARNPCTSCPVFSHPHHEENFYNLNCTHSRLACSKWLGFTHLGMKREEKKRETRVKSKKEEGGEREEEKNHLPVHSVVSWKENQISRVYKDLSGVL